MITYFTVFSRKTLSANASVIIFFLLTSSIIFTRVWVARTICDIDILVVNSFNLYLRGMKMITYLTCYRSFVKYVQFLPGHFLHSLQDSSSSAGPLHGLPPYSAAVMFVREIVRRPPFPHVLLHLPIFQRPHLQCTENILLISKMV